MCEAVRRKDREIADLDRIEAILKACEVASVAFGGESPYVIPMNYGFVRSGDRFTLYLHGALEGEKIDRIQADPRAAFAAFTGNHVYVLPGGGLTSAFDSVCGSGAIRLLEDAQDKRAGLAAITAHYEPDKAHEFPDAQIAHTHVIALDVQQITGKHHE